MKKKKLITTLCALALSATMTACSTDSSTSFAFRWNPNNNNQVGQMPEGKAFFEQYEYGVELKHESGSNDDYSVDYKEGTYVVTLKEDPQATNGYILESHLTISVQYTFGEETSEVFQDEVISLVKFKGESDLRPTYSEKIVHSHSPIALTATSLDDCYREFHYKTTTTYNDKCSSGTFTQEDLGPNTVKKESKKFSISSKRSYLDNEQLIFALRGISSSNTESISIFDGGSKRTRTVQISQGKKSSDSFQFSFNDGEVKNHAIDYIPFSVEFSGKNPGATQEILIAKYNKDNDNKYRNMILKMETPISFNLGTLVYRLKKANTFQ